MSTDVNSWQVDEMNSGLNEDFSGAFNSLAMESLNTFNMNETLLALPTLKNEQPNYDNKFAQQSNQDQTIPVTNINNLNSFNENNNTNLTNLSNNLQSLSSNRMTGQTVISTTNNNLSTTTNQTTSNCLKQNQMLTKFSNNKSNLNDLNKLEMMEIKQSVQNIQQQQNLQQKLNLKRSPVESPISMLEMQQNSPHCHSESSSTKSSISPGTSLSSSPTHYSAGYSNVHMLRNCILNEPTISINHSQTSTIPLTVLTNSSNNLDDGRPIAIVQGKKNRHNLNDDEDDEQIGSVKKFCVSNGNLNNDQLQNNVARIDTAPSSNNQSPIQSSVNSANDFRYLMQNHSFNCGLNNSNQLGNNLQTNLACNNQQGNLNQQTDNANLFSTAACCNTHDDCKSTQATDFRSCGQRHADSDFSYHSLYYHPNRITPSPSVNNAPMFNQFFPQSNQFMSDSSANPQLIAPQSQSSTYLFQQHRNSNVFRTHFQYILSANTSMASKVHEDSMTYLNQGQSYEIKLRKISGLELNGNILKSVVRVGFQERRLQYMEKELLQQWKQQRSSERILEIDIPLSYGVFEIIHPDEEINKVEFAWNPTTNKDSGIFIKLNAISTEFTPKKHGGEKGVPFRLIIETHMYSNNSPISLNTFLEGASCQIKVFKPKGADRKHKTDKEKMAKRSLHEQQKYLPSHDFTMFKPCSVEALFLNNNIYNNALSNGESGNTGNSMNNSNFNQNNGNVTNGGNSNNIDSPNDTPNDQNDLNINNNLFNQDEDCKQNVFMQSQFNSNMDSGSDSSNSNNMHNSSNNLNNSLANMINFCSSPFNPMNNLFNRSNLFANAPLPANVDSQRVREWLMANRFEKYSLLLQNFNSNDLLNLSREDLIQICELTDGIRLFNCLHAKENQPKTTIYLSFETGLFRAVYLNTFKVEELREKLLRMICENNNGNNYNAISSKLRNILIIGPQNIKVLVTEELISNLAKESMYVLQIEQDPNLDKCDLLLKPYK